MNKDRIIKFFQDKLANGAKDCEIVVSIGVLQAEGHIELEDTTDILISIYGDEIEALKAINSVPPDLNQQIVREVRKKLRRR